MKIHQKDESECRNSIIIIATGLAIRILYVYTKYIVTLIYHIYIYIKWTYRITYDWKLQGLNGRRQQSRLACTFSLTDRSHRWRNQIACHTVWTLTIWQWLKFTLPYLQALGKGYVKLLGFPFSSSVFAMTHAISRIPESTLQISGILRWNQVAQSNAACSTMEFCRLQLGPQLLTSTSSPMHCHNIGVV